MYTLKIEVNDTVFDKVMLFLNNLPKSDVKLTVENADKPKLKRLKSVAIKTKGYRFDREEANVR